MKKVLFVIIGILCALSAGAVSYASPYRGARRGYIYTTSTARSSARYAAELAQAPVVAMGSVSPVVANSASRGVAPVHTMATTMQVASPAMSVQGISTVATTLTGGVTTYDNGGGKPHKGGIRRADPGVPDIDETPPECGCNWRYDEETGKWICPICHCEWNGLDESCTCASDPAGPSYCWCPLELNWSAMVFLMLLAVGYGVRASMREKCTMKENENRA